MINTGLWTNWSYDSAETYLICGLILLNLISFLFMLLQRHRFTKLKRRFNDSNHTEENLSFHSANSYSNAADTARHTKNFAYDKNSALKIDRAINMLKSGASLIEIETALDIEPSYVTILKSHHIPNS